MIAFTGDRWVLRSWTESDLEPFAAINADPEVMEFFPECLTREQSDQFAGRIIDSLEREGFGLWALDVDDRFAGFVGLNRTAFETPMGPHVEIGWRLARWAWGRGLATEAANAVQKHALDDLGLPEIYSFTTVKNIRSEAVMRRIGMTRRPDLDFDHPRTPGWWGCRHIVYRSTPTNSVSPKPAISLCPRKWRGADLETCRCACEDDG